MPRTALVCVAFLAAWLSMARADETTGYLLQPGDVIDVSVLEDSTLNRQALVRPDGRISLPLAGALMAEGRTPEDLQAAIRNRLRKDFVDGPTVTVALLSVAEDALKDEDALPIVYVLGQVNAPGRFEIRDTVTPLQALAMAGGPAIFAAKDRIQVRTRDADGVETVTVFNYEAIEEGLPSVGATFELGDGDVIVVPERGLFD